MFFRSGDRPALTGCRRGVQLTLRAEPGGIKAVCGGDIVINNIKMWLLYV